MAKQSPLREQQVTHVFRALAEEHIDTRRKEREEQTWRRIQQRQNAEAAGIRPAPLPRSSWGRRLLWAGVPALAVAAALVFTFGASSEPGLEYQLVGGHSQGELITTDSKPAKLLFSDKSTIEAGARTTLNVHIVGDRKLVTRLSQGKIGVNVVHDPSAEWRFLAGPYEVHVVGTRFDLSWEPDRARLALVMHEGRVIVSGPGEKPRRVTAGEMLIADEQHPMTQALHPAEGQEPPSSPSSPAEVGAAEAKSAAQAPSAAAGSISARPTTAAGNVTPPSSTGEQTWSQQVAAGEFENVVKDARRQGISAALAQRDASELQSLAQAARYTGDTELAVQTWTTLRKRFARQPASAQASFFLGRIYDQLGQTEEALSWFDTYLGEAPRGVYVSETLGRKLTLVRALRGEDKAREVAREYLKRFPHGPYADTARDMLLND